MREQGANRKGFVAGFLLYGTWILTAASSVLLQNEWWGWAVLLIGLSLVALVLGAGLAVLALLEIRSDRQRYTSGSGPAIRTLVSAGIFCTLFGLGVWSGLHQRNRAEDLPSPLAQGPRQPIERPEFNFRLKFPPSPWVEMEAKKINPQATIVLSRTHPEMTLVIIAEKLAIVDLTADGILEAWKARLNSLSSRVSFTTPRPAKVNGLAAMRGTAVAKLGSVELAYVNVAVAHNGFIYQLLVGGNVRDEARINREVDLLVAGFELIDPSLRVDPPIQPAPAFTSKAFGYSLDLGGKPWTEWSNLSEQSPRAEFGALCGERAAMAVYPVSFLAVQPALGDADTALLSLLDLQHEKPLQRIPLERGAWIQTRMRTDQIFGFEQSTAVLALVAARPRVVAVRTLAFDVGIGQETSSDRIEEADRRVAIEQALAEQQHELVLHDRTMVVGGGGRVQVVADAQIAPVGEEFLVVALRDDVRKWPTGL